MIQHHLTLQLSQRLTQTVPNRFDPFRGAA